MLLPPSIHVRHIISLSIFFVHELKKKTVGWDSKVKRKCCDFLSALIKNCDPHPRHKFTIELPPQIAWWTKKKQKRASTRTNNMHHFKALTNWHRGATDSFGQNFVLLISCWGYLILVLKKITREGDVNNICKKFWRLRYKDFKLFKEIDYNVQMTLSL